MKTNLNICAVELRKKWLNFYLERNHKISPPVSLVSDGATGVMFNVAGMQPLMPFLLGKPHPNGKRLVNIQGCVRTIDIESVGDNRHCTYFEMMGNWSLGDYFKKEKVEWDVQLMTGKNGFGYNLDSIAVTCFEGNESVPKDTETAVYWQQAGIKKENIYFLSKKENWWELDKGPCGPDSEIFYINPNVPKCSNECNPSCDCGHFVEIGNDVYMQYEKLDNGNYIPLKNKNVDTGFGFERNLMFLNGLDDVYKTDLFEPTITLLENLTGMTYEQDNFQTKSMRIIADHVRTACMLLADEKFLKPSNTDQGYILRRLIRRAIRHIRKLGLEAGKILDIANSYFENSYYKLNENLVKNKQVVLDELKLEEEKFSKTLESGLKEFNKLIENLTKFAPENKKISGEKAFRLFDTFGFPLEITKELAEENGFVVDEEGYEKAFKLHREKSGNISAGMFKGGLQDSSEETAKLHTATHLLHNALITILKSDCKQMGSNITPERLRLDFSFDRKLTSEELSLIEDYVNKAISEAIPVVKTISTVADAKASGAIGVFDSKYGDEVSVYSIAGYGSEICGGPHAANTKDLGKFKIIKEESSSSSVRRIKAVLVK